MEKIKETTYQSKIEKFDYFIEVNKIENLWLEYKYMNLRKIDLLFNKS